MKMVDYLKELKNNGSTIIIFIEMDKPEHGSRLDHIKPAKFIGKIKHVFDEGVVLEKSEKYEEILVMFNKVVSIRKWNEK